MNIKQNLESSIIGVGDNYIVLENVVDYVDVQYTVKGVIDETFDLCYTSNGGEVDLNLIEITRLVYDNLANYEDPFDYTEDKVFTELDAYHFIKVDISITDSNLDNILIQDISVINAALDVGECLLLASLLDEVLNDDSGKTGVVLNGLNFDLNATLH